MDKENGGGDSVDARIYDFSSELSRGMDIVNETLRKYNIDPRKVIITKFKDHISMLVDAALFD